MTASDPSRANCRNDISSKSIASLWKQGLAGSDDYLNQWHWTAKLDRPGTAAEVLESISQELISEWDPRIPAK